MLGVDELFEVRKKPKMKSRGRNVSTNGDSTRVEGGASSPSLPPGSTRRVPDVDDGYQPEKDQDREAYEKAAARMLDGMMSDNRPPPPPDSPRPPFTQSSRRPVVTTGFRSRPRPPSTQSSQRRFVTTLSPPRPHSPPSRGLRVYCIVPIDLPPIQEVDDSLLCDGCRQAGPAAKRARGEEMGSPEGSSKSKSPRTEEDDWPCLDCFNGFFPAGDPLKAALKYREDHPGVHPDLGPDMHYTEV